MILPQNPHSYKAKTSWLKLDRGFGFYEKLRLKDAREHTLILGATGTGKTTCVLRSTLTAALRGGVSVLTFSYKASDGEDFARICREAGVEPILFGPGHLPQFPLLPYLLNELKLPPREVAEVLTAGATGTIRGQKNHDDSIWERSMKTLLTDLLTVLQAAGEDISIAKIQGIMSELQTPKLVSLILSETKEYNEEQKALLHKSLLVKVLKASSGTEGDRIPAFQNLLDQFQKLPPDTRGSVVFNWNTVAQTLERTPLSQLLSSNPNRPIVNPSLLLEKRCALIFDFPVAEYEETAAIFFGLFFKALRKAAQRRRAQHEVFVVADEFQGLGFADEAAKVLATGRSSGLCFFAATQSVPGLHYWLGEAAADTIFSGTRTTILCQLDDKSARYFEDRLGTFKETHMVKSSSHTGGVTGQSFTEQERDIIRLPARALTELKAPKSWRFRTETVVLREGHIYPHTFHGKNRSRKPSPFSMALVFLLIFLGTLVFAEPDVEPQDLYRPDFIWDGEERER